LRPHVYTNNLFNVYVTQVKSREEKNYSVQSHSIFPSCASLFHHTFLCSMNDNHWAREHSFCVTITSITSAKKCLSSSSRKSNRNIVVYNIINEEQSKDDALQQTAQILVRVYSSVIRWIEAIDSLLITQCQFYCFDDVKSLCSRRAIFFLREFCSFDTHSIVSLMSRV